MTTATYPVLPETAEPSPRVPAVPLPDADADDATWKALRRQGITASELAALVGASPHTSPFALWHAKRLGWELAVDEAMEWGTRLEDAVAQKLRDERPDLVVARPRHRLWRSGMWPWLMATPDFVAVDKAGNVYPVECKTDQGGAEWGRSGTDQVPRHHLIQIRTQCELFGAAAGLVLRLSNKRWSWHPIEYAGTERTALLHVIRTFGWEFVDSLRTGVPPSVDDHQATADALERLYPTVAADVDQWLPGSVVDEYHRARELYDAARDSLAHAERRYRAAQSEIRVRLGDAEYAVAPDGTRVARRRITPRRGYTVPPGHTDTLTYIRPKKEGK